MRHNQTEVQQTELDAMSAEGVEMAVHMATGAAFVFENGAAHQMTVQEALQWIHKREASRLANIALSLEGLRAEGVTTAYEVDAETLYALEAAGLMFDFSTGKVERSL